jgi:hypothetical protein
MWIIGIIFGGALRIWIIGIIFGGGSKYFSHKSS